MKHLVYYSLVVLLSCSCTNQKTADLIIAEAANRVTQNPDSALQLMQTIEFPENLIDSTKANYWLVLSQAHYNTSKSMADDSLILFSLDFYNKKMDINRSLQAYKLAAQHKWWKKEKKEAYQLLMSGVSIAESRKDTLRLIHLYIIASQIIGEGSSVRKFALIHSKTNRVRQKNSASNRSWRAN